MIISDSEKNNIQFPALVGWFSFAVILAALPAFLLAPYSLHVFDEPYQILNSYDWQNSVYSPLSAFLGYIIGSIFGWEYVVFRRLLVTLTTLSVYLPALYALRHSGRKIWVFWISVASVYFATVFKSDMNIYGWDNWTFLFVSILILLAIDLSRNFTMPKVAFLAFVSGLTVLMRLPNAFVIFLGMGLLLIYQFKSGDWRRIILSELLYIAVTIATCGFVLICLYGSPQTYLMLFAENTVGAHSASEVMTRFSVSFIYVMRFTALIILGYLVIFVAETKVRMKWLRICMFSGVALYFFIILFPFRREVIGNVVDEGIATVMAGILLVLVRGYKQKNRNYINAGFTLLLLCFLPLVGSNWGWYKFMIWPPMPILAWIICEKLTPTIKVFCISICTALTCYSFYCFWRPTFYDGRLNTLTHKLNYGVVKGMYTTEKQGARIERVISSMTPYRDAGYEIIPIRWKNEYIWEYIFLDRNPYQRHHFDYLQAFNDEKYVDQVEERIAGTKRPVAVIMFKGEGPYRETKMSSRLGAILKKTEENDDFLIFVSQ